jgi:hypothetical protein
LPQIDPPQLFVAPVADLTRSIARAEHHQSTRSMNTIRYRGLDVDSIRVQHARNYRARIHLGSQGNRRDVLIGRSSASGATLEQRDPAGGQGRESIAEGSPLGENQSEVQEERRKKKGRETTSAPIEIPVRDDRRPA